jgi:hypothetical protein
VRRRVGVVARAGVVEAVPEQGLVPAERAVDRLRVRVEQQLGRIAAVTALRLVRPVHAVAVPLARRDARQVAVPDERVDLAQVVARLRTRVVEQAELDPLGDLGEQREVRAGPVVGGAERVRRSRPQHAPDRTRSAALPNRVSGR